LSKLKKILNKFPTKSKAYHKGFSSPNNLLDDQKAQAEAVFRLMIDSVIGLAILLVIMSALNYFQGQVVVQSKSDFFALVKNAVNTPNGAVLMSKELTFPNKFSVDAADLQNASNLSENCFEFDSMGSVQTSSDKKEVRFSQSLKVIVYAKCNAVLGCDPYNSENCCTQCIISFARPLTSN
jgi:hypothetical protein